MVFSSVVFLFAFLPCTLILHYFLDPRYRNVFLLLVSLLFYAWGEGILTLLILTSIAFNYTGGLLIGHFKQKNSVHAKTTLGFFIAVNIAVLLYFKYSNFFLENLQALNFFTEVPEKKIHLPIGISFYTFHIISYLIDVYRRDAVPQKNPFDLGLYIFLFPQLVAGPIIRYKDISQKIASRFIIGEEFSKGAVRFIRGLAKKMIIANTAAIIADQAFSVPPAQLAPAAAWLGIISYSLQIYFDFSGYSDMALGLAKMMGFTFPENFMHPYQAASIQDFWRRWHISLSTWFRDYLYIPLGGSKTTQLKTYRNLFIVFFVTGFWHGASWNFIVWGMLHGVFLALERAGLSTYLNKTPKFLQHIYTLTVVVFAWVFFRADNLNNALQYIGTLFGYGAGNSHLPFTHITTYSIFVLTLGFVFSTNCREKIYTWYQLKFKSHANIYTLTEIVNFAGNLVLFLYCSIELAQSNYNPFIYFRF